MPEDNICCVKCGCQDLQDSGLLNRLICRYCGHKVRVYLVTARECDSCGSENLKISTTLKTKPVKRYLICRDCGGTQTEMRYSRRPQLKKRSQ